MAFCRRQHGNPALFGHLEENYKKFNELGFREDSVLDSLLSATAPPLAEAARAHADLAARKTVGSSVLLP